MHISKIKIRNFRLLKKTKVDINKDLSLFIGKNNSGKTSLLVLFERFFQKQNEFNFNDFSLCLRNDIKNINLETNVNKMAIQLILEINYEIQDNLEHLADFIVDLDPARQTVKILFECTINKEKLVRDLENFKQTEDKYRFIEKELNHYLVTDIYTFDQYEDLQDEYRESKLIKKSLKDIEKLINFQIIHAKRDVASSEANGSKKILSGLTTDFFNKQNSDEDFRNVNREMIDMDNQLDRIYENTFEEFLKNSKEFLELKNLKVVSNLQSNELVKHSSQIIYGDDKNFLPEHLNGLGYMNILYLLLSIEMKKEQFKKENKDINLLIIEEPEAHTHPQLQYIFANEIKKVLKDKEIGSIQTLMTSHSTHIVSECDFEDIRCLVKENEEQKIIIKNFAAELREHYKEKEEEFQFVKQYLTIHSAELFFASKVIFIEGTTERMMLPYFINKVDRVEAAKDSFYERLALQNISILEVGANAKAFNPFLKMLNIKTLVITDIDTTEKSVGKNGKISYKACKVENGENTSNETLKFFLNAPDKKDSPIEFNKWLAKLEEQKIEPINPNFKVAYQKEENGYCARSFEDAFLNMNFNTIKNNKERLRGLKNKDSLNPDGALDIYSLTNKILDKKSDFASSLLYLALSDDNIEWNIPAYIEEGLLWLGK